MEDLSPSNIPVFGYPSINYTPRQHFERDARPTRATTLIDPLSFTNRRVATAGHPFKNTNASTTLVFRETEFGRVMQEASEKRAQC